MKNPCKQCLIKMMCSTMCDEKIKREDIIDRRIKAGYGVFHRFINGCLFVACVITFFAILFKH
jgi:hypothetical protein